MHNPIVGGVLLAIHLLSVVTWVGGMFFALTVLRPSMGVIDAAQRVALHAQVFRRFFLVLWHVMPLTLLSGFAMVVVVYGGFAGLNWSIQAMMGLGILMALVFLAAFFSPWKRMRRAISTAAAAAAADRIRKLVLLNLVLGLVVVAIAGFGRFYF
jgi:uncharacterized membrane protein